MILWSLFLIAACGDPSCGEKTVQLEVCLADRNNVPTGAKVYVAEDEGFSEPVEALIEEDGCVTVDVAPGPWWIYAENPEAGCQSEAEEVDLSACLKLTKTVDITELCTG